MIISNHLLGKMELPEDTIIRVNLAWIKDANEAHKILTESEHDIYLDFPDGRTKPPRPTITLLQALVLSTYSSVKYFAISNAEDVGFLKAIQKLTPATLVPKIETVAGVKAMPEMIDAGITTFMLDKEDLYTNVQCDADRYNELVREARRCAVTKAAKLLELQGVCFG